MVAKRVGESVRREVPMPSRFTEISLKQIMPRLGIAYRLTDTLVLRTGAGQFYNAQQINNHSRRASVRAWCLESGTSEVRAPIST